MNRPKLVAATRNPGKVLELGELLRDLPFEILGLRDYDVRTDVAETGESFGQNAEIKASAYALLTGELTLADDSGLVVDALGGAPGVLSARYAGAGASDTDRIARLLMELGPTDDRRARFVCAISLAAPDGALVTTVEGRCEGSIAYLPRGLNGFGYDPIFIPDGFEKTFGELSARAKSEISHRAVATAEIKRFLLGFRGI